MVEVISVNTGFSILYLVRENNKYLLIDSGRPVSSRKLSKKLKKKKINPADISLIIVTHVHYDHVGNLKWLKEQSKAPVMVHIDEAGILERGEAPIPEGTTFLSKIISYLGKIVNPCSKYYPVKADILINEVCSLNDFGFTAAVIPTPGHTGGSISVIFGTGETFVGDTCFNLYWGKTVFPMFANDVPRLMRSWQTLIDSEARIFYPGHGKPFLKETLKSSLEVVNK